MAIVSQRAWFHRQSARRSGAFSAIVLMSQLGSPAALAQLQAEDERQELATIEEIVITARRRQERLQDVPVAVSAFSNRRIEQLQADDLTGLQNAVPNLYLQQGDARNAVIYIRGIGQNDSLAFADPGVGVYVDDVFIARSQAAVLDLFDVERVEVLRGPQGTLYGRNTIGGAVKFVSQAPPDALDAYVEAGGGNFDFGTLKGRIGGPLVDGVLRGKVAFAATHRSGFADNVVGDEVEDDGGTQSFAWRTSLLYTPTEDLDIFFSFDGKLDRPDTSRSPVRETPVIGFPDPVNAPFSPTTFPPNADPFEVNVNANQFSDLTAFGLTLKANWQLSPAWSVESITAYRTMDFDLALDTDGTPLPILDILVLQDQEQFSQELRATYESAGPLTATAGVYFFRDDDVTFSGVDFSSVSIAGFPITFFIPLGFSTSQLAETDQETHSIAAFADATYELTDRLSLSAGLRYTFEEKDSARRFENFFDPTVSVVPDPPAFLQGIGTPGPELADEGDFDAFTPKVSLSYRATEDVLLYASASRGFKSGGFDGRAASEFSFQPFEPEIVWTYEGGVKSSWAGGRLIANAAYFYTDYNDLQVTSFGADPQTGAFLSLFTNAAEATIQGVDLELRYRPTERLALNAAVGYLDAEYDAFEILVGGVPTDVSDRPLVNAPEWTAFLGGTYDQPLSGGFVATLHADAAYRGKVFNEITGSEILAEDDYVWVNAFVSLKTGDERWELRGGVQNITDQAVRVQGFNLSEFPGYQLSFFSAPRTWDIRLFYRY